MSHFYFKPKLLAMVLAASGLLTACGGGGGSAGNGNIAAAKSSGTISGLGSIIVNGVRYETVGASVWDADDGSTAITTPLRIGMTVSVEQNGVDLTTGRPIAGKIWVRSGLQGLASLVGGNLTVAGLPVTSDSATIVLDANGLVTSLVALNTLNVEVYGLPQADGTFLATLVEAQTGPHPVRMVGTVQSLNTVAKTLVLGTSANPITVDYTQLTPPNGLVAGAVVVVRSSATSTSNTYAANSLQVRSATASDYTSTANVYSGTTGVANERNELYGAVSEMALTYNGANVAGCAFNIQGVQVMASSATLCTSLANGAYVEAKGTLRNGVLNATRIEFEGNTDTHYVGNWNDSNTDGLHYRSLTAPSSTSQRQAMRSFELYGALSCTAVNVGCTLTSGSVPYTADMTTAMWDHGGQGVTSGYVEAKGYLTGTTFKVLKIEAKNHRYGDSSDNGEDD